MIGLIRKPENYRSEGVCLSNPATLKGDNGNQKVLGTCFLVHDTGNNSKLGGIYVVQEILWKI